jgi:hypothetical protein
MRVASEPQSARWAAPTPKGHEGPKGIGGWLLIPILNALVLIPLKEAWAAWSSFWGEYGKTGAPVTAEAEKTALIACLLITAAIYLALVPWIILLLKRHRFFPAVTIFYLVAYLLLILVLVSPSQWDLSVGQQAGFTVIWVWYMLQSDRVRNTFGRPAPARSTLNRPVPRVSAPTPTPTPDPAITATTAPKPQPNPDTSPTERPRRSALGVRPARTPPPKVELSDGLKTFLKILGFLLLGVGVLLAIAVFDFFPVAATCSVAFVLWMLWRIVRAVEKRAQ